MSNEDTLREQLAEANRTIEWERRRRLRAERMHMDLACAYQALQTRRTNDLLNDDGPARLHPDQAA